MPSLSWKNFTELFHNQLGYKYPEDMRFADPKLLAVYSKYNETGVLDIPSTDSASDSFESVSETVHESPVAAVSPAPVPDSEVSHERESVESPKSVQDVIKSLPLPDQSATKEDVIEKLYCLLDAMTESQRVAAGYAVAHRVSRDRQARSKHGGYKVHPETVASALMLAVKLAYEGKDVKAAAVLKATGIPDTANKSVRQRVLTTKAREAFKARLKASHYYESLESLLGKTGVSDLTAGVTIGKAIRNLSTQMRVAMKVTQAESVLSQLESLVARVAALETEVGSLRKAKAVAKVLTNISDDAADAVDAELMQRINSCGETSVRKIADATGINRNKVQRLLAKMKDAA